MTYVDTTQRDDYTAASGQTVFAYTFRILTEAELLVYDDGTLKTLTTDYTISGVGDAGGGNVTFVTGVTEDNAVLIIRDTADTQNTDYTVSGAFPAESHEQALDKLTMKVQDLDEKLGRAIKFAITSTFSDIDFPELVASRVVAVDGVGTGLELLNPTIIDAVSVIAVKGDMVQGGDSGDAEKLAVGVTSAVYQVVAGKIASVTNPIFLSPTIADTATPSKDIRFIISGATATKTLTLISAHTDDRSITFPNVTDTLVGKQTTDTLENKTMVAPILGDASATSITLTGTTQTDTNTLTKGNILKASATFGPDATLDSSYNVSSVDDDATGRWGLNINTNLADAFPVAVITATSNTTSQLDANIGVDKAGTTAGTVEIICVNNQDSTVERDPDQIHVLIGGNQ